MRQIEREIPVTLKKIVSCWNHPALNQFNSVAKRPELCMELLPDAEELQDYLIGGAKEPLSEPTLRMLVSGNRKSKRSTPYLLGSVDLTNELINGLNEDRMIELADGRRMTYRTNLLGKLEHLVETSVPELEPASRIFAQINLEADEPGGPGEAVYAKMRALKTRLLEDGSVRALTYVVFMQVIAAWVQWRVEELPWLYDEAQMEAYLAEAPIAVVKRGAKHHRPFRDPAYSGKFHVYLYRATRDSLYESGTLEIKSEDLQNPSISLHLEYAMDQRAHGEKGDNTYRGMPVESPDEKCVYALMEGKKHELAFLCFAYEPFQSGDMYYRSGLLLRATPRTKTPQVQKIVITAHELSEDTMPYVKGVLAISGERIVLTDSQLQHFLDACKDYAWMPEFERGILPFIKARAQTCYCFDEGELLAYSLSQLSKQDRLRILLALKGTAEPGHTEENRFARCTDAKQTHEILL